jgi:hypothetical protein
VIAHHDSGELILCGEAVGLAAQIGGAGLFQFGDRRVDLLVR